ncbi:MAG: T9SS type A sorting domain-containing protein [Bacteroidetes bacterium]|nr:T9SS type A sorting domain-containing protein [Bacteroidota bacterium]
MKKMYVVIMLCIMGVTTIKSQSWREDMLKENANFYDVQKKYASIFSKQEKQMRKNVRKALTEEEEGGFQIFKRWEYFMEERLAPSGKLPNPMMIYEEMQKFSNQNLLSKSSGAWVPLGPTLKDANNTVKGLGRINGTAQAVGNSNYLVVASASGGIWTTSNGGVNWETNTDGFPVLGFSNTVIHPQNSQIIYAASGDGEAGDTYGLGVVKSIDGGQSWNLTGLNFGTSKARLTRKLVMHPTNYDELLAATNIGLYKTTDGGITWNEIRKGDYRDIEYKPGDPNTIYAVNDGQFFKTTDGGTSWVTITTGLPATNAVSRLAIAVTPANASYVYLVAGEAGSQGFEGLYRSTNDGTSFTMRSSTPNLLGWSVTGNDNGGQAWYDLAICASPVNAEMVFVGGVNTWRSTNGGSSWACKGHWQGSNGVALVHADIHNLEYFGSNLYSSNDGGVYRSTDDGNTWTDLTSGIEITQFYRLSCSQLNSDMIMAGAQDNNSSRRLNNTWKYMRGGDGMEQLIHTTNTSILFSASQYGSIGRSTNSGASFSNILGNLNGTGDWVTPFVMTPGGTLYVGYSEVYRSTNNGSTSTKISNLSGGNLTLLHVSPSDSNHIICGRQSTLLKTSNGGTTWTNVSQNIPNGNTNFTYAWFHPTNPLRMWVTCSGYIKGAKVFETNDGGATWTNITGNLPNIPVNCIIYENGGSDGLYIGTDAGIFYKNVSLKNWQSFMTGLPNVIVRELEIVYPANKIRAATYGRGVWESELYTLSKPVVDFTASRIKICTGQSVFFSDNSTEAPTSFQWVFSGGTPATATTDTVTVTYNTDGIYDVKLVAQNSAGNDSVIKTALIEVSSASVALPFAHDFEGNTMLPATWALTNPDIDMTWVQTNVAGGFAQSSKSAMYKNFGNYNTATRDFFVTDNYDFSALTTAELSFDVAYARQLPNNNDSLIVYASDDCGLTYSKVYAKGGSGLKTYNAFLSTQFIPVSWDWRKEVVSINQYAGKSQVMFKFEAYSAGGNNLYLDNINLGALSGIGINELQNQECVLNPNPANGFVNLNCITLSNRTIELFDLHGRMVKQETMSQLNQQFDISRLESGVYFMQITDGQNSKRVVKLVKQ